LGILNYIIIISHSALQAAIYALVFGLGTSVSPLILLIGLSGKLSGILSRNKRFGSIVRIVAGSVLIFLAAKIILQRSLR
jgi:sulfite exporter TauE/SafE